MISFYNTLSGSLEPFSPIEPGKVGLYTCGPTVYDYPHIGNWRAYVFEDLLKRFLIFSGFHVYHVMNLTDVDDKTIRGANAKGVSLDEYTKPFIEAFYKDRDTLNILPADQYPRATRHIDEMVGIIKLLLEKGFAYRKEGSIYFAIDKFPSYGRLSKINLEDRRPGSRGDADEYEKESVHDFALWKAPKEGEPFWETDIGPGRPGWHIECSAMSSKYLGRTFDIHCGGVDNIFPHHENEIAQSEAANGVKFVNYWLHCHHLVVDGEKMSKSKGNFFKLEDLLARGYDPLDIRYLLITTHYRRMLDFNLKALEHAATARRRIGDFLGDLAGIGREGGPTPEAAALLRTARTDFTAGLEDDLNISGALAAVFELISGANRLRDNGALTVSDASALTSFIRKIDDEVLAVKPPLPVNFKPRDTTLEVQNSDIGVTCDSMTLLSGDLTEESLLERIEARQKARKDKDFKLADSIRDELLKAGVVLEDTRDGVRWKLAAKKSD